MKEDKLIDKIRQEFETEIDSIPVNKDLLQRIKEENLKKRSVLPLWFQSPVWSYGFGLASLLFACLYFFKPTETSELIVYRDNPPQIVKDTLFVKDTVFIEKEVVTKNTRLVSNPSQRIRKPRKSQQVTFTFNEQYFDAEQLEEQQKAVGKSSEQSEELAQFLGVNI